MTALVTATEPGPWSTRTHELGDFVGVRVDGRVVAMAGQRMRLADAIEISAVCTDPAHRGRGYARAVVAAITARTAAGGPRRSCTCASTTRPRSALYERLGFRIRATLRPGVYRHRRVTAGCAGPCPAEAERDRGPRVTVRHCRPRQDAICASSSASAICVACVARS